MYTKNSTPGTHSTQNSELAMLRRKNIGMYYVYHFIDVPI
jgi:hypothetical protein